MREKTKDIQLVTSPTFIGSRGRPGFPMSKICAGFYLLVEPAEELLYRGSNRFNKLVLLDKNGGGFGYMVNAVLKKAQELGQEYFMSCDDDLLGFSARDGSKVILDKVFEEGVEIMRRESISQLGICFSGHDFYKLEEGQRIYRNPILQENIGAWCMFIGKTEDFLKIGGYDLDLPIFQDFEVSARLLVQGYKVSRWNQYHFDHKMKSLAGGASHIYSKKELIEKAIEKLKVDYGEEMFRIKQMHGQSEVRFRWNALAKKGKQPVV